MPAKLPESEVTTAQITTAKVALDAARQMGDELKVDLAENTLNNLLDRYHAYHTSQSEG
jgi:hypothetical protein